MADSLRDAFVSVMASAEEVSEAQLQELVERARGAWPELEVSAEQFVRHLAQKLSADDTVLESLAEIHVEDLWLAFACSSADPRALALFDARVFPKATVAIERVDGSAAFVDEVCQVLREKLFLPRASEPPRIAEYSGQGPLVSWLRAAAARTALNLKRPARHDEHAEDAALEAIPLAGPDPELALLRNEYRAHFHEAFQRALASLSSRERTVLKLQALDGLTLERIGEIYGTHKSTVSRWLSRAHETLLALTRQHLAQALALSSGELDSVVRAMRSQLELSVSGLLRNQRS